MRRTLLRCAQLALIVGIVCGVSSDATAIQPAEVECEYDGDNKVLRRASEWLEYAMFPPGAYLWVEENDPNQEKVGNGEHTTLGNALYRFEQWYLIEVECPDWLLPE